MQRVVFEMTASFVLVGDTEYEKYIRKMILEEGMAKLCLFTVFWQVLVTVVAVCKSKHGSSRGSVASCKENSTIIFLGSAISKFCSILI